MRCKSEEIIPKKATVTDNMLLSSTPLRFISHTWRRKQSRLPKRFTQKSIMDKSKREEEEKKKKRERERDCFGIQHTIITATTFVAVCTVVW
jgi:hypothetical protein